MMRSVCITCRPAGDICIPARRRRSSGLQSRRPGTIPWWNSWACRRCCHSMRWSRSVLRSRQGTQLQDVRRRDPALGEAALEQQVHHQLAVGVVSLGPALRASQRAQLGGIGEVSGEGPALDLLHHEAPARRALQGKVGVGAWLEPLQPLPHCLSGSGVHPVSLQLAGAEVNGPERDLPRCRSKPLTISMWGSSSSVLDTACLTRLCRGGPSTCHLG
jgi:hypothetical protein